MTGVPYGQFSVQKAITEFLGVTLSTGNDGKLTPIANVKPVNIGGVSIRRASLSNWELIGALDLHIGDTVEIERYGDGIPSIMGVIKYNGGPAVAEPSYCPVCNGAAGRRSLGGVKKKGQEPSLSADTFCMNPDCEAKSTGKIKKWVHETGMMDIGSSMIEAMVDRNLVEDPADLYLLVLPDLSQMPFGKGIYGEVRATKAIMSIQSKKHLPLNTIIGALGVQGLGEGIAKQVREKAPGQFDTIADWMVPAKLVVFKDQISLPNAAEGIANALEARRGLLGKLMAVGVTVQESVATAAPSGPLVAG